MMLFSQMNLPNKLTMLRILLIPVFVLLLMCPWIPSPANRYLALIVFAVASITDALDGYIARSQNLITNFGKFMDPLADKLLVASALVAFVGMGYLPAWIVIIILSREFAITGFRTLAAEAGIVIAAGVWGKFKTISQMVMVIYILVNPNIPFGRAVYAGLVALALALTIISGVDYIWKNRQVLSGG